jgi:hypothetical protein
VLLKQKKDVVCKRAIIKFVKAIEPILCVEKAVLQFFALTNQLFNLIEHKSFKNLYRFVSTTCLIESANTLYSY